MAIEKTTFDMGYIDTAWSERYKRLGFTAKDIELYECPMHERKNHAAWRKLDEAVFSDLKKCAMTEKQKSSLQIITDSIEVKSQADGKVYSSKHKYYQSLKDHGSHVTEAGEHGKKLPLQGDYNCRKELTQAVQQHLGR